MLSPLSHLSRRFVSKSEIRRRIKQSLSTCAKHVTCFNAKLGQEKDAVGSQSSTQVWGPKVKEKSQEKQWAFLSINEPRKTKHAMCI